MIWLETYLFYCSVRLGVVIVSVLTFIQVLIPMILLILTGSEAMDVNIFRKMENFKQNFLMRRLSEHLEHSPQDLFISFYVISCLHMFFCLMAMYGAFKLNKWCLLPFITIEGLRALFLLYWHVMLMIFLKKSLNLGLLITFILLGSFVILYLFYNWATVVALFQIITLIRSSRYRSYYGDDPLKPYIYNPANNSRLSQGTIENVRVLITPQNAEKQGKAADQNSTIISVLPVSYRGIRNHKNWVQRQAPWWHNHRLNGRQDHPQHSPVHNNDYTNDYDNWHWAELLGRNKTTIILGQPQRRHY